jgi:hypothetical protein
MSRRKGEVTGHMNEREFPHLVELELPPGGLPSQNLEFDAFHREHGIPIRRRTPSVFHNLSFCESVDTESKRVTLVIIKRLPHDQQCSARTTPKRTDQLARTQLLVRFADCRR